MRHALVNTIILAGTKSTITNETSPLPAKRTTHERYTVILKKYGDSQFFLEEKKYHKSKFNNSYKIKNISVKFTTLIL